MKLLTLNCHSWFEEHQEEKIQHLVDAIQQYDYDVIAFQEVSNFEGSGNPTEMNDSNFVVAVLKELEKRGVTQYKAIWGFSHFSGPNPFEEGSAILTKHDIVSHESFVVTQNDSIHSIKTRRIIRAKIRFQDRVRTFYSCHMGWWTDEIEPFQYQADRLLAHVSHDEETYIMGDFNNVASVRDEGYDYLCRNGFYDTYELAVEKDSGITVQGKIAGWEKNKDGVRIDLILVNRPVSVTKSVVIFNDKNHPIVSDHYGVHVEIGE